jgi:hypothetical protein
MEKDKPKDLMNVLRAGKNISQAVEKLKTRI